MCAYMWGVGVGGLTIVNACCSCACVSMNKCHQKKTDIYEYLKTNSCKGSGHSMTSVDKRLCVGFSGAGDSSAPQAGGKAFQ